MISKENFYSTLSEHGKTTARIAFARFEQAENEYGKDLMYFTPDELMKANEKIPAFAHYQNNYLKIVLKNYYRYGMENGLDVLGNIEYVSSPEFFVKDMSSVFIASPLALSQKFIEWFPAIYYETTPEIQYATLLWLCFEGLSLEEIVNIKVEDVTDKTIKIGDKVIKVPIYMTPFVLKTRDAASFLCHLSRGSSDIRHEKRCNNGYLIRTENTATVESVKSLLKLAYREAKKDGYTLSTTGLNLSGICYETRKIQKETGIFTFNVFHERLGWDSIKISRTVTLRKKLAKYDYANYIRAFYPDEAE